MSLYERKLEKLEELAGLQECSHPHTLVFTTPDWFTPEAEQLARRYLDAQIFPATVPDDALHVAIAILTRQDVLVSWNFKHLVNQR